jgi:N6-adenosine-specific RNA methylase IME4
MNLDNKFKVLVSDCPWQYSNFRESRHGAAEAKYATMPLEELKKIPVQKWLDKDCIHFMWATWPHLAASLELMTAWGFEYKTGLPWVKTVNDKIRSGIGFFTRSASELLLIGVKGHPQRKLEKSETPVGLLMGEDEVFYAPIGKHSKKPENIQDWIGRAYDGPKLELFATRERQDWVCLGSSVGWVLSERGAEKIID